MAIGIDIDDTLSMTSESFLTYALIYDKELRGNGIIRNNNHNVYNRFDWSIDEYNEFYRQYEEIALLNAKIFPYAKDVIDRLRLLDKKIAIITARSSEKDSKVTHNWLEKNGIKYDNLVFSNGHKGYAALALGVTHFLDDSSFNCEDVNHMDIKSYIYTSNNNKDYYHENIERVNNWLEFYKKICGDDFDQEYKVFHK